VQPIGPGGREEVSLFIKDAGRLQRKAVPPARTSCAWSERTPSIPTDTGTLVLAGDMMLGRGVAETLRADPSAPLISPEVAAILSCGELRLRLIGLSDHPSSYAAGPERPGIAYAELRRGLPEGAVAAVAPRSDADLVLVLPHWGPNMVAEPVAHVRRSANALLEAGAGLLAGHSAHVFQGVAPRVIFDLGDFIDDYIMHPKLRNDLGLLWLVELGPDGTERIRALPLALEYCFTRRASPAENHRVVEFLRQHCGRFGTEVHVCEEMIHLSTHRVTQSV
jgi:poly-gamma-glutamate synthesis protein (capsule biosynthesis protein)